MLVVDASAARARQKAYHCHLAAAQSTTYRVGEGGFEPPTASSQRRCATTAPLPGNALLAPNTSVSSACSSRTGAARDRRGVRASERGDMKLATRMRFA